MKKKIITVMIGGVVFATGLFVGTVNDNIKPTQQMTVKVENAEVIYLPSDKYPKTAEHIIKAIEKGESNICTIDRKGATENRKQSLKGIPTKKGYDRDEFPMAMCEEGGTGADVEYVPLSDNRGSGSWISNQLDGFKDGEKVIIDVK